MKFIRADEYYFEIDDKSIAYRQLTHKQGEEYLTSIYPDFFLTDQEVCLTDEDQEITEDAFEKLWRQAIEPFQELWLQTKSKYSKGDLITGSIAMFYPQGVIIRIENQVYAVTDYQKLSSCTRKELMYPGYRIQGTVSSYDESNLWLVLRDCVVLEAKE